MLGKIKTFLLANVKLIFLSFEMFWIMVFLLSKITSGTSTKIPQFIYVNF